MNVLLVLFIVSDTTTAVAFQWTFTERVDDAESLGILREFMHIGVVMNSSTLALATKEVFQRVLTQPLAQKRLHIRLFEEIGCQLHKRFTFRRDKY